MNESWYWIKQRPHFIAEHLGKYYQTEVFCEKRYKSRVENKIPSNLNVSEIYKLPLTNNVVIKGINKILHKYFLFNKYFKNTEQKYDIIWFGSPKHFDYMKRYIGSKKTVIYDCMDDLTEFEGSKKSNKILSGHLTGERALYERSDIVFCSSGTLKEKLFNRYGEKANTFVINNALSVESLDESGCSLPDDLLDIFKLNPKTLCYIGTVSEWFDFDVLIKCLDEFKETGVILIGPNDVEIPKHVRLYKYPPVNHGIVLKIMKKSDALIMPFTITELVKGVNPVKLYEYIYSCVPAIAASYPETKKFGEFVYLYDSYEEFGKFVQLLCRNSLPLKEPKEKYIDFAMKNTWEDRIEKINNYLKTAGLKSKSS